ncbi:MAG: adenylosuccinate synthetase, partial [Flammeovirgaceae bacterium]|nr:adenylosuccinate synthetase [Flammeovirgaceae bacterium]
MKKKASIVIGLGYGDEGKGSTTDYLAFKAIDEGEKPLVIRFNGGQQAGHTVMTSSRLHHVFSNFGAGTLRNVPTYWSAYCTFAPGNYLKEWVALRQLEIVPRLYLDGRCPVTTHYDVLYNRCLEDARGT